jgi:hypothetical protein
MVNRKSIALATAVLLGTTVFSVSAFAQSASLFGGGPYNVGVGAGGGGGSGMDPAGGGPGPSGNEWRAWHPDPSATMAVAVVAPAEPRRVYRRR